MAVSIEHMKVYRLNINRLSCCLLYYTLIPWGWFAATLHVTTFYTFSFLNVHIVVYFKLHALPWNCCAILLTCYAGSTVNIDILPGIPTLSTLLLTCRSEGTGRKSGRMYNVARRVQCHAYWQNIVSTETFTRYHDGRYYRPYKKSANCIRGCVHSQAGGGGGICFFPHAHVWLS